ncbi:MAG: nucleoside phosphorylase [Clostridia bacterium]|nr:nucleoside phosphorylase [Clostridia bacterium]
MSIINTFDPAGEEIIRAADNLRPIENFPKTMVVVFSVKFRDLLLKTCPAEEIGFLVAGGQAYPIHRFTFKGVEMGFFSSPIGGAASAALLEELIALGAEKFLYFGSCGALDCGITQGKLLVPTAAYRDEGVSYHYAPPADFMEIPTASRLMEIFSELHIPHQPTRTWTTDSFYRETKTNVQKRREAGCGVVEMECASLMAVGQFRGVEVYQFLYAADCLDGEAWDKRILGNMPQGLRDRILLVALEAAGRL